MCIRDSVKQVFRDQGFAGFTERISGEYAAREYCVQYRETDFHFVSRLMEEEGIYFYFTHENGKHHLVLADSPSTHDKFPGYEQIPYHPEQSSTDKSRADHIHEWTFGRVVQPGAQVLTDYDFKKPKANLLVKSSTKLPHAHSGYERFDYPGRHVEIGNGEHLARSRMEEILAMKASKGVAMPVALVWAIYLRSTNTQAQPKTVTTSSPLRNTGSNSTITLPAKPPRRTKTKFSGAVLLPSSPPTPTVPGIKLKKPSSTVPKPPLSLAQRVRKSIPIHMVG